MICGVEPLAVHGIVMTADERAIGQAKRDITEALKRLEEATKRSVLSVSISELRELRMDQEHPMTTRFVEIELSQPPAKNWGAT